MSEQDKSSQKADNAGDSTNSSNIIQFPGAKREVENKVPPATSETPTETPSGRNRKPKAGKASTKLGGSVLAIALATAAVNRFALETRIASTDASSNSPGLTRGIASVERPAWQRDADWEMNLSERLASVQVRDVASAAIGHQATPEEKLRWGTLEEKYTILYKPEVHVIDTIVLQDPATSPSYILDRNKFLHDYGALLDVRFASAKLKSIEVSHDKTVEFYTIFDKDHRPQREARFELDVHKRLLSLKMEPAEI